MAHLLGDPRPLARGAGPCCSPANRDTALARRGLTPLVVQTALIVRGCAFHSLALAALQTVFCTQPTPQGPMCASGPSTCSSLAPADASRSGAGASSLAPADASRSGAGAAWHCARCGPPAASRAAVPMACALPPAPLAATSRAARHQRCLRTDRNWPPRASREPRLPPRAPTAHTPCVWLTASGPSHRRPLPAAPQQGRHGFQDAEAPRSCSRSCRLRHRDTTTASTCCLSWTCPTCRPRATRSATTGRHRHCAEPCAAVESSPAPDVAPRARMTAPAQAPRA
eukprot:1226845-Prymnesium_polylepis.2